MLGPIGNSGLQQTTTYKVVLPFYVYAALSFILATILLLLNTHLVDEHFFHPHTLAIVHSMALGWGTMIIFGASHQLLPVLIEGKLDSNLLAYLTFIFSGIGIPFLIVGFYQFQTGFLLQTGAILVNLGVLCYMTNVLSSIYESKKHDVHAWYMGAAALWLFSTTFFGLLLVFNFTRQLLPNNSVAYLSIHAHMGLIGWFLMLVIGVASRLIPMFLISKYDNKKTLWLIFILINLSLLSFIFLNEINAPSFSLYLPLLISLLGIVLFARHCYAAYRVRIRKNVDNQMKISLLSVLQMLLPKIVLFVILILLPKGQFSKMGILYGFSIFFGWLTAIILGMTFKTLPFIVWNKVYHNKAHAGKTPVPKDLFSEKIYDTMSVVYLVGFLLFLIGIIFSSEFLLKIGAFALVTSAALYVSNVFKTLLHQPKRS